MYSASHDTVGQRRAGGLRLRAACWLLGKLAGDGRLRITSRDSKLDLLLGPPKGEEFHLEVATNSVLWDIFRMPDPGLGEAFMHGAWRLKHGDLGRFLTHLARGRDRLIDSPLGSVMRMVINARAPRYAHDISSSYGQIQHHYDLGNDLYASFLDAGMNYSCAFFDENARSLRDAQLNKIAVTLDRLQLQPGMRVLDIGCGWGEVCREITARTGKPATGITLAEQQVSFARDQAGTVKPEFLLQDYREHAAKHADYYDRIVSIGMVEHVGEENIDAYFGAVASQLKPGGRAVIHGIVRPDRRRRARLSSPWLTKYIFPGGHIPAVGELEQSARQAGLRVYASHIHGPENYAETLRQWRQNFLDNYSSLDPGKYDVRFQRMWLFYLCMCEAMFEGCRYRVAQVVVEKPGADA